MCKFLRNPRLNFFYHPLLNIYIYTYIYILWHAKMTVKVYSCCFDWRWRGENENKERTVPLYFIDVESFGELEPLSAAASLFSDLFSAPWRIWAEWKIKQKVFTFFQAPYFKNYERQLLNRVDLKRKEKKIYKKWSNIHQNRDGPSLL